MARGQIAFIDLTPENFDQVVFQTKNLLVVIYFWGDECPNCEDFKKYWPEIASELSQDPVKWVSANVYKYNDLALRFGLHGVPTFLLVKNGVTIGKMTGFESKDYFVGVVRDNIS